MKRFKTYFLNRQKSIEFMILEGNQISTPKYFHQLRVEIKKLNALFNLIEYCSPDFEQKKTYKPFKKIMRQAGKIREIQVEESSLKKYFTTSFIVTYRNNLQNLKLIELAKFNKIINESIIAGVVNSFNDIKPFLKKINKKKLTDYIERKGKKINKILAMKNLPISSLHELRKRLKIYSYIQNYSKNKKLNSSNSNIERLLKLLGKWHDLLIIIKHLQKAIYTVENNSEELIQLNEIKKLLLVQNQGILNKIKRLIPEL